MKDLTNKVEASKTIDSIFEEVDSLYAQGDFEETTIDNFYNEIIAIAKESGDKTLIGETYERGIKYNLDKRDNYHAAIFAGEAKKMELVRKLIAEMTNLDDLYVNLEDAVRIAKRFGLPEEGSLVEKEKKSKYSAKFVFSRNMMGLCTVNSTKDDPWVETVTLYAKSIEHACDKAAIVAVENHIFNVYCKSWAIKDLTVPGQPWREAPYSMGP